MLGQCSAVTFKSLFSKPCRSTRINKMCFLLNECKRGHRKGLEASNIWVSAACYVSTAPSATAASCPYLDHPSPQTFPSSHLQFIPQRKATNHGVHCHRKNYPLSDFPVSLNHFAFICNCSIKSKRQIGTTRRVTEAPRHGVLECVEWSVLAIAVDYTYCIRPHQAK